MQNKTLKVFAIATVLATLAPLAQAATFPYSVPVGQARNFQVTGAEPVTLDQDTGMASIANVVDLGNGNLLVTVACSALSSATCTGDIVTS